MKTVRMERDFYYRPPNTMVVIVYKGGRKYDRVPEAAAAAIVTAKRGAIAEVTDQPHIASIDA